MRDGTFLGGVGDPIKRSFGGESECAGWISFWFGLWGGTGSGRCVCVLMVIIHGSVWEEGPVPVVFCVVGWMDGWGYGGMDG